jgi:hypothetical protein
LIYLVLLPVVLAQALLVRQRGRVGRAVRLVFYGAVSALGLAGIFLTRLVLVSRLPGRYPDALGPEDSFIAWAMGRFDGYALWATLLNIVVVALLLAILTGGRAPGFLLKRFGGLVSSAMASNVAASFLYSMGTFNKFFDLASYIGAVSVCHVLMLHLLLLCRELR